MAQNGISTLATKEARQKAKLDLAAVNRSADSNSRATYDITQLPTQYNSNAVLDNANVSGLVTGRPWVSEAPVAAFTLTEIINTNGDSIEETNVGPLTLAAKSSSYQVNPVEDGFIKVNGTVIKTTNLAATSRGHTLAVVNPAGATVGTITTYDTFGVPADLTALASALAAVSSGNYIVLVSWDACAVDAGVRSALNANYGTTLTTTWAPTRNSHIVIAKKL